jgi:8-oxo-dGTP pyrophosphatase MutT (NUDIX family)
MSGPRATSVGRLLGSYVAQDPREAEHLAAMNGLLRSAPDPFSRHTFAPGHFTASAFVTSPDGGSVALIHHAKLRRWLQPGGHFEPEDVDLVAAVRREVVEETGLSALSLPDGPSLLDVDVHEIPAGKDPAHLHFDLRVHLRAVSWELRPGSDVLGARWVPLAEVGAEDSDESVLRAVRRLRS